MDTRLFLLEFKDFGLATSSHGDTIEQDKLIDPTTKVPLYCFEVRVRACMCYTHNTLSLQAVHDNNGVIADR